MSDDASGQPIAPPARVRVTAQRRPGSGPVAVSSPVAATDASLVYLGTLIRAQLRLAVTLAVGFAATLTVASVIVAATPMLHTTSILGVPWSWALQAYAMYPIVIGFALLYVRGARRNERRYRSLESQK